jgi:hypothetical protein
LAHRLPERYQVGLREQFAAAILKIEWMTLDQLLQGTAPNAEPPGSFLHCEVLVETARCLPHRLLRSRLCSGASKKHIPHLAKLFGSIAGGVTATVLEDEPSMLVSKRAAVPPIGEAERFSVLGDQIRLRRHRLLRSIGGVGEGE